MNKVNFHKPSNVWNSQCIVVPDQHREISLVCCGVLLIWFYCSNTFNRTEQFISLPNSTQTHCYTKLVFYMQQQAVTKGPVVFESSDSPRTATITPSIRPEPTSQKPAAAPITVKFSMSQHNWKKWIWHQKPNHSARGPPAHKHRACGQSKAITQSWK